MKGIYWYKQRDNVAEATMRGILAGNGGVMTAYGALLTIRQLFMVIREKRMPEMCRKYFKMKIGERHLVMVCELVGEIRDQHLLVGICG